MVLTTVVPSFQTRLNCLSPFISTCRVFSFFCSSMSFSGFGGPGTWASAFRRAVRDHEIQHANRGLVDVVLETLRLAVENGEAGEGRDGRDESERRAVHGFRDSFGEDSRLLARVHALAPDRAERLDETDDGPEQ